jgi:hypothetical protein
MYGINRKTGAQNLYMTTRKIWYMIDKNGLALKAVHIPGKLNTTMDKLSCLEMSGDYSLPRKTFQFIQETLRCYLIVDMFASKKNQLLKKYASVIPTKDPDNVKNALRIDWRKFVYPMLLHPPIPLILKTIQKFANEGSKAILIVPKWKGQVWSTLVEEFTMSRITLGDAENVLIPGKNMGKRNMFLPPGKLYLFLLFILCLFMYMYFKICLYIFIHSFVRMAIWL